MTRPIRLFLSLILVHAAIIACVPKDVVNPVTPPPAPVTPEPEEPDTPGGTASMTICTFNIRYANTADTYPNGSSAAWSVRAPAVKQFIDTAKPDLIGLQEVRREQSNFFSSSYFNSEYGYYDVCRDSSSGSSVANAGGEGVGVMYLKSRFELVQKDFFWLDNSTRQMPAKNADGTYGAWNSACRRVTVYVVLKDKKNNDALVYFFPTHYDHKSADARKNSAELMVSQMKALTKETDLKNSSKLIIHVGDLNTTSDSSELKPLNDSMEYARLTGSGTDRNSATFNGFGKSSSIIDHIYYGCKSLKPGKYWVEGSNYGLPYLSDHNPVLFQFEY